MPDVEGREVTAEPQPKQAPLLGGVMAKWLAPTIESRIERIACDSITARRWVAEPHNEQAVSALRESIAARGIVEPLLLRRDGHGGFEVVCGAWRLRAALDVGLTHVPAIVRDLTEHEAVLVAAWSTVERRRAIGGADAFTEAVLTSGLSVEEIDAVLAAPDTRSVPTHAPALFLSPAQPLSRPRSAPTLAAFERPAAGVLPLPASRERTMALAV